MKHKLATDKLAALIKAKRGAKGLRATAREIGGISPSTLSRVEQGKSPDLDMFLKLCAWLEVQPEDLLEAEGETSTQSVSQPPLPPGMSTPEIIEVHLRADRELDPATAKALADLVKAAYNAVRAND